MYYNFQQTINKKSLKKPTDQQLQQIKKTQQYMQKHKIHQICNELVSKLIQTRPQKVKEQMINILKKIKQKQCFFKKTDFEGMFQSYDVFAGKGNNQISYQLLIQALEKIGVCHTKESFLEKYPQFKLQKGVKKRDFVSIMENQYKSKINFS